MVLLLAVVLRRSKPKTARGLAEASLLNKLDVQPLDLEVKVRALSPFLPALPRCHSGVEGEAGWEVRARGMGGQAQSRSSSIEAEFADVIHVQQRPLRAVAFS